MIRFTANKPIRVKVRGVQEMIRHLLSPKTIIEYCGFRREDI